ncbi:MAG: hypothetical protein IT379_02050, partial [Deltaproteobacteria bacterium]|nr:hypothetical protein [Deltaproteobacteria bacterium]
AALRLPDGRVLPESLAVWLAFDNRYPSLLSVLRGDQPIVELRSEGGGADRILAVPAARAFTSAYVDDVRDEVDDDVVEYLRERVVELVDQFPGHVVRLNPRDMPDRFVWFGAPEEPLVLVRSSDELDVEATFTDFALAAYEDLASDAP